jgi:hypothetical protein
MKQKLIMEAWRKFVQEQKERGVRIPEENTCLYSEIEAENALFVLYGHSGGDPADALLSVSIIGSVSLESLDESGPCISGKPSENPSWHILGIHTNKKHRAVGYGSFLYGCAFLVADNAGAGLTSDKYSGSKEDAKIKWSSFEADAKKGGGTYELRQTPDGSDKFDYDGNRTPNDPNDDCGVTPPKSKNASDSSISHKNPEIYENSIILYEENHMNFLESLTDSGIITEKDFIKFLHQADAKSFDDAYADSSD